MMMTATVMSRYLFVLMCRHVPRWLQGHSEERKRRYSLCINYTCLHLLSCRLFTAYITLCWMYWMSRSIQASAGLT